MVEVFNTALRWDPEITDLFVDENRAKAFHAFYAFGLALGKNRTKKFLQPLVQAMEKFLEGVASYQQRSLEIPEELKESILKDLDRLIALAEWGKFALPAK
ncbi:MAG: hypothetical protein HY446_01595 [Candidatus Niyogibacteria bacterium]|nr:hypothetical protein [Candidatus Niyogibacteria bacterium]